MYKSSETFCSALNNAIRLQQQDFYEQPIVLREH